MTLDTSAYVPVIGLEVHLQLATSSKVFCTCPTTFAAAAIGSPTGTPFGRGTTSPSWVAAQPNSQVCPVCLGFPGVLPVLNRQAFLFGIRVALGLGCRIEPRLLFHRKNYFYPDLPKGFQISQYDLPLARGGFVELPEGRQIRIHRVHMEEDAGKLLHRGEGESTGYSLVDFNRGGIPLLEIVSEPDITSAEETTAYLKTLKGILEYLEVSDCDMEKGSLRCDANISIREDRTDAPLGTKVEIKNLNSFKAVARALRYEIERQKEALAHQEPITQETRLWDDMKEATFSMRTKEYAHDYRYFPEPDLVPFAVSQAEVEEVGKALPELPKPKAQRFMKEHGLSLAEAQLLTREKKTADYFEECFNTANKGDSPLRGQSPKTVANWILGELSREMNEKGLEDIRGLGFPPARLLELIGLVDSGTISHKMAKDLFSESLATQQSPGAIAEKKKLAQVTDRGALKEAALKVIGSQPKAVADYRCGKEQALKFLVGQLMRETQGIANPSLSQEILLELLKEEK